MIKAHRLAIIGFPLVSIGGVLVIAGIAGAHRTSALIGSINGAVRRLRSQQMDHRGPLAQWQSSRLLICGSRVRAPGGPRTWGARSNNLERP